MGVSIVQGGSGAKNVVNDHMYPRPYIVFDPKGVI